MFSVITCHLPSFTADSCDNYRLCCRYDIFAHVFSISVADAAAILKPFLVMTRFAFSLCCALSTWSRYLLPYSPFRFTFCLFRVWIWKYLMELHSLSTALSDLSDSSPISFLGRTVRNANFLTVSFFLQTHSAVPCSIVFQWALNMLLFYQFGIFSPTLLKQLDSFSISQI